MHTTLSEVRRLIRTILENEDADEKPGGYAKPTFRGTVFGQAITGEKLVPTGKKRPWTKPDGETVWVPIKHKVLFVYWVWDGTDWYTEEAFKKKYPPSGTFKKKPGQRLR
jgi:hypothetical protein